MKRIEFYKNRKIYFAISAAIVAIGIILCCVLGVRLDIQFKGGSILSYTYKGEIDANQVNDIANSVLGINVSVTETSNANNENVFKINAATDISTEQNMTLDDALAEAFPEAFVTFDEVQNVSASMGTSFLVKSILAIALAAVLMVLYIWWRFRKIGGLSAAVFALVALVLDVSVAFFAFVGFGIPLNDNFVAVILTIFGYSINDTIVIFDRIRENELLVGSKYPTDEIVTRSINQSLGRSINTSVCTFAVMAVLSIFALIANLDSLISFAIPMMFGIVSGVYSSTFVTGPLWAMWKMRKSIQNKAE